MSRNISFVLNGEPATATVEPHHNLVEMLQRDFNLTGARESCGQGMCGCCTVLVNGTAVSGCLYLAVFVDGGEVATVEHLARGDQLDPVHVSSPYPTRAAIRAGSERSPVVSGLLKPRRPDFPARRARC